jgi:hypothetical protein
VENVGVLPAASVPRQLTIGVSGLFFTQTEKTSENFRKGREEGACQKGRGREGMTGREKRVKNMQFAPVIFS